MSIDRIETFDRLKDILAMYLIPDDTLSTVVDYIVDNFVPKEGE